MTATSLPRWQCHKIVEAAKIRRVIPTSGSTDPQGAVLLFSDPVSEVDVSQVYLNKHAPQVGGYYVRYEDGYESFSPAEAFEAGYTRLPEAGT